MTLLPLSPILVTAFVGLAATLSAGPSHGADRPAIHKVSDAGTGWQQYLINGAGPVFRHPSGPLRG